MTRDDLDELFDQSDAAEKRDFDRQFENYSTKFVNAGFREALEDDELAEKQLQDAFDKGYKTGYTIAKDFQGLRFKMRLVEGLYDEKRIELQDGLDQSDLEQLEAFNEKLEGLNKGLVKDVLICTNPKGANDKSIGEAVDGFINMSHLKSQAKRILDHLDCSIKV